LVANSRHPDNQQNVPELSPNLRHQFIDRNSCSSTACLQNADNNGNWC
jgi:hypothetical protein